MTYAESLEAMIKALDELVHALNESVFKKEEDHDNTHGE